MTRSSLRPHDGRGRSAARSDHTLSRDEFRLFRDLIRGETGIALSEYKLPLVQARLAKHLRTLGLRSYRQYYEYLMARDPRGDERTRFINALTTNKTAFFREPHHFEYLARVWLPMLEARARAGGRRRLRIWSAGSSTGEEPYSIAMVVADWLPSTADWDVRILASDIDTDALEVAERGNYRPQRHTGAPASLKRYTRRGRDGAEDLICVAPEARRLVTFRRINLLEQPWPIRTRFDCVFLRNVMIYFDRPTREHVLARMHAILEPEGLLILGHSESLLEAHHRRFRYLGRTIYQRAA